MVNSPIRAMFRSLESRVRALVTIGSYGQVDDKTEAQSGQVSLTDGAERADVDHFQSYGLAAHAPSGAECVALHVGADPDHVVVIAVGDPGTRPRELKAGEAQLYNGVASTRVYLREDGSVHVIPGVGKTVTVAADPGALTLAAVATVGSRVVKDTAFDVWIQAVSAAAMVPPYAGTIIGAVDNGSATLETDKAV